MRASLVVSFDRVWWWEGSTLNRAIRLEKQAIRVSRQTVETHQTHHQKKSPTESIHIHDIIQKVSLDQTQSQNKSIHESDKTYVYGLIYIVRCHICGFVDRLVFESVFYPLDRLCWRLVFDVLDHWLSTIWRLCFDCLATHPNRVLFEFDRPIQGSPQMTFDPVK